MLPLKVKLTKPLSNDFGMLAFNFLPLLLPRHKHEDPTSLSPVTALRDSCLCGILSISWGMAPQNYWIGVAL